MKSKLPGLAALFYAIGGIGVGMNIGAACYGYGIVEPVTNTSWFSALGVLLMIVGWTLATFCRVKSTQGDGSSGPKP
ncbi:MAG: hypothetical protein H0W86_13220 [Armatimonadetes bacterium]|nr:hypothetical protein [Armatimonadota bacterium]